MKSGIFVKLMSLELVQFRMTHAVQKHLFTLNLTELKLDAFHRYLMCDTQLSVDNNILQLSLEVWYLCTVMSYYLVLSS